jgi:hypothetical protein
MNRKYSFQTKVSHVLYAVDIIHKSFVCIITLKIEIDCHPELVQK